MHLSKNSFMLDTNGKIYSCISSFGINDFLVSSSTEDIVSSLDSFVEKNNNFSILEKHCEDCCYFPLCFGGCAYENYNKTGYRFSLDKFDDKKLVAHLTARSVTYDTASVHKWTIKNYMIREMEGMREKITRGDRLDTIIKMEPQDFLIMKGQQQTMTSPELKEYIDKQKRRGFANIKEFEIEYYQRIAMSFAAFILTTIGVSLSSRKMKGGMGLHLGVGLALSFSYILFQTVSATFAVNGNTPPIIAVWIPNILYTFIAIYLYRKAPK
jgi:lipopolysaccharide export system permease protein